MILPLKRWGRHTHAQDFLPNVEGERRGPRGAAYSAVPPVDGPVKISVFGPSIDIHEDVLSLVQC